MFTRNFFSVAGYVSHVVYYTGGSLKSMHCSCIEGRWVSEWWPLWQALNSRGTQRDERIMRTSRVGAINHWHHCQHKPQHQHQQQQQQHEFMVTCFVLLYVVPRSRRADIQCSGYGVKMGVSSASEVTTFRRYTDMSWWSSSILFQAARPIKHSKQKDRDRLNKHTNTHTKQTDDRHICNIQEK